MTITLQNQTYRVVLTMAGSPLVIVQRSARMWRVAREEIAAKVLAGFQVRIVR